MAWWDGDEIDYDADQYQDNDGSYTGDNSPAPDTGTDWYQENDGGWNGQNSGGGGNDIDFTPGVNETNTDNGYTPRPVFNPLTPAVAPPNAQQGIEQSLAGMFMNPNTMKLAAAMFEGNQNKQKQQAMNKIATNPALDPFGSQRPFYQQQAQAAVTNPYDSPIVKAQIEQLQRAQSIKDAAAGRRSNSLQSSPAVMAEMARIAQSYQQQMANQGGAQFGPNGAAISGALQSGANAGINGYISPMIAAGSNIMQDQRNDEYRQKYIDAITKFRNQG